MPRRLGIYDYPLRSTRGDKSGNGSELGAGLYAFHSSETELGKQTERKNTNSIKTYNLASDSLGLLDRA